MKKTWILSIITLIILGFNQISIAGGNPLLTSKDELVKADFKVSGLELGQPISKVADVLGKSCKYTSEEDVICYEYPGLTFKSFPVDDVLNPPKKIKNIDSILIKDKKVKTFRDISLGDKVKEVYYQYGKTRMVDSCLIYETDNDNMIHALSFKIIGGKVKSIEIYLAED